MTSQNRIFDDLSKLMTNAMGVAQGARSEAETAFKGWIDRWLAERDLVTREEFEVVREMAVKARTEAAELRARLDRIEGTVPSGGGEKTFAEATTLGGDAAHNSDAAATPGSDAVHGADAEPRVVPPGPQG